MVSSNSRSGVDSPRNVRLFSFADSSAATFKRTENGSADREFLNPVVKPTAYNITAMYPYVMEFDTNLIQLFSPTGLFFLLF